MARTRGKDRAPKRWRMAREDSARINYRDTEFLRQFLTERGRIRPRSATGLSRRDQARLARAVKVARELALLPYRVEGAPRGRDRGER